MPLPLLAIGPHIFDIFPLNLQKIEDEISLNWPSIGRFGRRPNRQFTGIGDEPLKIEGLCFNEEFGGYEDYLAIKETARQGVPVDVVSWGSGGRYVLTLGAMAILRVGGVHEHLGADGIGRKLTFSIDLSPVGNSLLGGLY